MIKRKTKEKDNTTILKKIKSKEKDYFIVLKRTKIDDLPKDVYHQLFQYITEPNDWFSIVCTCKRFNEMGKWYLPFRENEFQYMTNKCRLYTTHDTGI